MRVKNQTSRPMARMETMETSVTHELAFNRPRDFVKVPGTARMTERKMRAAVTMPWFRSTGLRASTVAAISASALVPVGAADAVDPVGRWM